MSKYTVQEVTLSSVNTGKKPYSVANVTYTNDRGENKEKKIMSFANPAVYAVVSKIKSPTAVEVENDGAPYYNWSKVTLMAEEAATKPVIAGNVKVAPSTYETAEERKIKQLYIIRQSSITNALTYLSEESDTTVKDVLKVAQEFVDFVYGNKFEDADSLENAI